MSDSPSVSDAPTGLQRLARALTGGAVEGVLWLLRHTSWKMRNRLARWVGAWISARQQKRHSAARTNLDLAFGDTLPAAEKERLVTASFQNFVGCLLDALAWVPRLSEANWADVIHVPDADRERMAAIRDAGHGALILFSHYGAWELMGAGMPFITGVSCGVVARRQEAWINPVIERFRTATGNYVIYKEGAVRTTLKALKQGGWVGFSIDQNFTNGIFVPFFGLDAGTTDSVAALSRVSGAPIVPLVCTPNGDGTYTGRLLPPVQPVKTADKVADLHEITRRCNVVLEQIITERPELWLWGHKRWKSRPPDESPPLDLYPPRRRA